MNKTGIVEGFFGPQWPETDRKSYAEFLARAGGDFYIYAPKQDPNLRKKWREEWSEDYIQKLRTYTHVFHSHNIQFGVGFSPFGLGTTLTKADKTALSEKLTILNELGIDLLGLFFDDMPVTDNLAETQIETLEVIQKFFKNQIIFCPSYYTPDPILDKVFGQRPANYLQKIAAGIPQDVSIAWTGPKVISPEIPAEHLKEVTALLKRKPFIWENLFANDGPKNCKLLKLRPFSGRDSETTEWSEAFGFNMMNQPQLSKITYLASVFTLHGETAEDAFEHALDELASHSFKDFIKTRKESLLTKGLDNFSQDEKNQMIDELRKLPDAGAKEIIDWLEGQYNVGSECLTD
jgi:hyaluronoglucosaminidase